VQSVAIAELKVVIAIHICTLNVKYIYQLLYPMLVVIAKEWARCQQVFAYIQRTGKD
jgi:hypothetical protein